MAIRVAKVRPKCMCGEFYRGEGYEYECTHCGTELDDWELETIDYEE